MVQDGAMKARSARSVCTKWRFMIHNAPMLQRSIISLIGRYNFEMRKQLRKQLI